jgi:hypothetical protein
VSYCDHCWKEGARHKVETLRRRFIGLCDECHHEAYAFEVLPMEGIKALPDDQDTRGVYFLWDGDELQYIGQSMQIGNRINDHERAYNYGMFRSRPTKQIKFDKVTCLILDRRPFASRNDIDRLRNRLLIVERAYIERYKPPFNTEWFL